MAVALRKDYIAYVKYYFFILDAEKGDVTCLPNGMVHGFYTLSEMLTILCKVTSEYALVHDSDILWAFVQMPWIDVNSILLERE